MISEDSNAIKTFETKLSSFKSKFNQYGGKKKSKKTSKKKKYSKKLDDSSDLDSSEDFYKQAQTYRPRVAPPLYYWWYDASI